MRREDLPIGDTCQVSWEGMEGRGRRRHCGHCDKEVVNLSEMTEREAASFLADNHAPCVRYHVTAEGEILFRDPQVVRQRSGVRRLLGAAALVAPLLLAGTACGSALDEPTPDREPVAKPVEVETEPPVDSDRDELDPVDALAQTGDYLETAARRAGRAADRVTKASADELGALVRPYRARETAARTPSNDSPEIEQTLMGDALVEQ